MLDNRRRSEALPRLTLPPSEAALWSTEPVTNHNAAPIVHALARIVTLCRTVLLWSALSRMYLRNEAYLGGGWQTSLHPGHSRSHAAPATPLARSSYRTPRHGFSLYKAAQWAISVFLRIGSGFIDVIRLETIKQTIDGLLRGSLSLFLVNIVFFTNILFSQGSF